MDKRSVLIVALSVALLAVVVGYFAGSRGLGNQPQQTSQVPLPAENKANEPVTSDSGVVVADCAGEREKQVIAQILTHNPASKVVQQVVYEMSGSVIRRIASQPKEESNRFDPEVVVDEARKKVTNGDFTLSDIRAVSRDPQLNNTSCAANLVVEVGPDRASTLVEYKVEMTVDGTPYVTLRN